MFFVNDVTDVFALFGRFYLLVCYILNVHFSIYYILFYTELKYLFDDTHCASFAIFTEI